MKHQILGIDASNISSGGGALHLIRILENENADFFPKIFIWGFKDLLDKLPNNCGLIKIAIPKICSNIFLRLIWQIYTFSSRKRLRIDILFVPGGLFLGGFRPFVTMFQNMQVFDLAELNEEFFGLSWIRLRLLKIGQAYTFKRSNGLICLSEHSIQFLRLNYPRLIKFCKTAVIGHGIDSNLLSIARRPINFSESTIAVKFLYVSTIKAYKHQWNIIRALSEISSKNLGIELHLIGGGDSRALSKMHVAIVKQTKEYINFRVKYHGDLAYEDVKVFYAQCDCFVFASSCETFGIALLEAMGSSLPIVASNSGPVPEILRDAGLYFDPRKVIEIRTAAEVIISELKNNKYNNVVARNYSMKYSWDKCSLETFSFINLVLANSLND